MGLPEPALSVQKLLLVGLRQDVDAHQGRASPFSMKLEGEVYRPPSSLNIHAKTPVNQQEQPCPNQIKRKKAGRATQWTVRQKGLGFSVRNDDNVIRVDAQAAPFFAHLLTEQHHGG